MNAKSKLLVITIVLIARVAIGSCKVIYVTPEKEHSCPNKTQLCLTLSHIAENPINYFSSNTRIIFISGNHTSDTKRSVIIANVSNIILEGSGSTIQCNKDTELGFVFMQITNLSIINLHLYQCGAALPLEIQQQIYKITTLSKLFKYSNFYTNSSPALYFIQMTNITTFNVTINSSIGPGVLGFNIIGHSTISQSSFIRNKPNCALLFMDTTTFTNAVQTVELSIFGSEFLFGKFVHNSKVKMLAYPSIAAGLSAIVTQTSYKVLLNISNVTAQANSGNLFIQVLNYDCSKKSVIIRLCRINCSHSNSMGLSLQMENSRITNVQCEIPKEQSAIISQSYFGQNAQAVDIRTRGNESGAVTLVNTIFHTNSLALRLENVYATLNSTSFLHNTVGIDGNAPIQIQDSSVKFQGNTTFQKNSGETAGAIYAYASQVYFEGNVKFVDNKGYDGGAIALYEKSKIILTYSITDPMVSFIRNYARHYGGAIYVDTTEISMFHRIQCFYSLEDSSPFDNKTVVMIFTNNTSGVAGSAIYGGWVKLCTVRHIYSPAAFVEDGYKVFEKQFEINTDITDLSPVSSEPVRVCLCVDSKPACNITYHTIKAYPGETVQVSAVGVGQMYGTVPSIIHARFKQTNTTIQPSIGSLQQVQKVEQFCSHLSYIVKSSNTVESLILTVQSNIDKEVVAAMIGTTLLHKISPIMQFFNVFIHIHFQTCPLGFIMNKSVCVCHPQLQDLEIQCNITTGRIYKNAPIWVNATFRNGVLSGVISHQNHPFDYFKPQSLNLSLDTPDEQCAFHRSGVLCGACQFNLSQVLGSSNCKECSNLWLLLIPVFAIAGIVLVFLLMVLNITVSVGTINGLIFYANIVRANQAAFSPHSTDKSWFIAWMNLDLGFEVCFYNGMDAYAKTWLQFVFPVYIWVIVILIIVSSHYYTTAAKITGKNAVPILATLLILSYAKLLRLTITIFSSTTLKYPDGSLRRVWLYDGNVDYLKGKHIPLFMAAVLVLLVLSLPYTALLLFIQCLQLKSKYRALFWIRKFKPLFDAYTGPYKDKHRYWTGLLLLVRAVLFLIFSVNVFGDPAINFLAIATTMFLLSIYVAVSQHVYKAKYLNMLEYSSFLNLGITSTISLYTIHNTKIQTALTYTSVGIAFVTFCIIVLYHAVIRIKTFSQQSQCCQPITTRMKGHKQKTNNHQQDQNQETYQCSHNASPPDSPPVPITFLKLELHKPLLEHCDNS